MVSELPLYLFVSFYSRRVGGRSAMTTGGGKESQSATSKTASNAWTGRVANAVASARFSGVIWPRKRAMGHQAPGR